MSLFKVFEISGSGMSAQAIRMNTTASNIANAESVSSSDGGTYRARQPVFATMLNDFDQLSAGSGVQVQDIVESQAPLRMMYRPDHPLANEEGMVFMPNVNAVEEMANMISASRSFQSNVEILNASKQMLLGTLNLGQ